MKNTIKQTENWKLVVKYMDFNNLKKSKEVLTTDQFNEIYSLADGFGDIGTAIFSLVGYDWSHIRDSSDFAIDRMANRIREILKKLKVS